MTTINIGNGIKIGLREMAILDRYRLKRKSRTKNLLKAIKLSSRVRLNVFIVKRRFRPNKFNKDQMTPFVAQTPNFTLNYESRKIMRCNK
jgi:hypothetical protein